MRAAEQERRGVQAAGRLWRKQKPDGEVRQLVFIDETGLNTKLARHYGRCPTGQRCVSAIPHGHWQSSTFIPALRHDTLVAPFFLVPPPHSTISPYTHATVLYPKLLLTNTIFLNT